MSGSPYWKQFNVELCSSSRNQKQIIIRDNATCNMCGKVCVGKDLQVDHKVARANGGTDDYSNLWILCQRCHAQKGRKEGLGF